MKFPDVLGRQVTDRLSSIEQRLSENEIEIAQLRDMLYCNGMPVPPPKHLQMRVAGIFVTDFVLGGARGVQLLKGVFGQHGDFAKVRRLWDFGCGCGRVSTHFALQHPDLQVVGSDIDPEPIAWLGKTKRPNTNYYVNDSMPPCPFDGDFDFVYSISVFTHLPEDMQFAWLEEVARQCAPGAIALLTKQGEHFYKSLPMELLSKVKENGFYYHLGAETDGLPEFYRSAYHTDDYIHRVWSKYFDILDIIPRGYDGHQDIVVCRKRP